MSPSMRGPGVFATVFRLVASAALAGSLGMAGALWAQEKAAPPAPAPAAPLSPTQPAAGTAPPFVPPDVYRLPFVIPGGVLERNLPRDEAHWIPKAIGMRFGENHLLYDPETCAVRGWWRSGEERLRRMDWGSRVYAIPGEAAQTPEVDGARFEWGPRDAYGVPPAARFDGYRWPKDGRVEIKWSAGEGAAAVAVTEVFRRADATWNGVALDGVSRRIRAAAQSPPGGPAAVGGRFRHLEDTAPWVRADGKVVRIEAGETRMAVKRGVRLVLSQKEGAVALAFQAADASAEIEIARPDSEPGALDVRWRAVPADAAAKAIDLEMGYYRLPAGTAGEQAVQGE